MKNGKSFSSGAPCRRVLFAGNSHTYQPKELGGVPQAVARVAAAVSMDIHVDSVTKGGADLLDLWEEFEAHVLRSLNGREAMWDTFVLQVGRCADSSSRFALAEVLRLRYAPLLLEVQPNCKILLYQTWATPHPTLSEAELLNDSLMVYHSALLGGGLEDISTARVGHAFLALRDDPCIYPALFKDDSGHGSALAGVLIAAVIGLALGIYRLEGEGLSQKPLGRILEGMLPKAWRTASAGFVGDPEFGQKSWLDVNKGVPKGLKDIEDDGPLSKYPPGMRTEKSTLDPGFGGVLAAVAIDVTHVDGVSATKAPTHVFTCTTDVESSVDSRSAATKEEQSAKSQRRRWGGPRAAKSSS